MAVGTVDFATFNKKIDAGELKGMFRSGWQMDYPSIENFLTPIYAKGAELQLVEVRQRGVRRSCWPRRPRPPASDEANAMYQAGRSHPGSGVPDRTVVGPFHDRSGGRTNVTDVKLNAFGYLDLSSIKTV